MDELGSGVLNVNKYLPVYAPGKKPQFIEGSSFKMIIPLDVTMITKFTVSDGTVSDRVNKGVSEGIIEGISEGVKGKLLKLVFAIMNKPLQKADELATGLNVSVSTVNRYIKILRLIVKDVLTKSPTHPHGIKVRLESGIVGRVKNILS